MNKSMLLRDVKEYLSCFGKIGKNEKIILRAIEVIDRKNFVIRGLKRQTYFDSALPSGHGQTISQPSTVARMLQLLDLNKGNKVLEIGCGSGWNSALIGFLVGKNGRVLSLEVVSSLIRSAKKRIKQLKIVNVEIKKGDFRRLGDDVKFDKIIFTAGILSKQEDVIDDFIRRHLKIKGIAVCPHQSGSLIVWKLDGEIVRKEYTEEQYSFVPLVLD